MARDRANYVPPPVPAKIKLTPWGAGTTMYRVHETIYAVEDFNSSRKGNARFSPILDSSGNVIPTLYAATTPRGALMESVFRNVPYRPGFKHVDLKRLEGRARSALVFQRNFQLLDLSKVALRGLGIPPRRLIDTTKAYYPVTKGVGRAGLRRPCQRPRDFSGRRGRTTGLLPWCCSAAVYPHRPFSMASTPARLSGTEFPRTLSSNWQPT